MGDRSFYALANGETPQQYVWSPVYVDAMVLRDKDLDGDGAADDERLYAMHDANFNVTGLVDSNGDVIERYFYDPYGAVTVLDAGWSADGDGLSDVAWNYLHQGGRYDGLSGMYHFRHREYDPSLGRWVQQDPMGYVDGGNLFQSVLSNPIVNRDPLGLATDLRPEWWKRFYRDSKLKNVAGDPDNACRVCDDMCRCLWTNLVCNMFALTLRVRDGAMWGPPTQPGDNEILENHQAEMDRLRKWKAKAEDRIIHECDHRPPPMQSPALESDWAFTGVFTVVFAGASAAASAGTTTAKGLAEGTGYVAGSIRGWTGRMAASVGVLVAPKAVSEPPPYRPNGPGPTTRPAE